MIIHESDYEGIHCHYGDTQDSWEEWLRRYHQSHSAVWLIIYKITSGISSVTISKAIEIALCHGWVDSKKKGRDEQSYYVYFSKRNPKSNWSKINKDKIKKLQQEGRLTPAAEKMILHAKNSGTWDALNDVENLVIPEDLLIEFKTYSDALLNWNNFPRSTKRAILLWIYSAKRLETRKRRIKKTAKLAQQNIRAIK